MKYLLEFAFLFMIGSVFGWILELFYRRFVSNRNKEEGQKWINPGFLIGPYLPLYGFCSCVLYLLSSLDKYIPIENIVIRKIVLIFIMIIAVTLVEYIAGLIFIKKMNIKLWDYSNIWGNIQGIICPLYSLFWGILGALYHFFLYSHVEKIVETLFLNLQYSFFMGIFYGIFFIDFFYSAKILVKLKKFADDNNIVIIYEDLKRNIRTTYEERVKKHKFFAGITNHSILFEHLKKSVEQKEFPSKLRIRRKK